jgi:O-antigen/teichoic acid export membrane protein
VPDTLDSPARLVTRNFLALGAGEAVSRLILFGAMVYVARHLGAAMFGVVGVAAAIVLYFNRIADGGLDQGLGVREIAAEPARLETEAPELLTARTLLAAGLATILVLTGLLLLPRPDGTVLAVTALTLLAVGAGTRWIHLGLHQNRIPAIAITAGLATAAVLMVALVHGPGDVALVPAAQFAGDSLAALLMLLALRRSGARLPVRFNWSVIRPLLPRARALVVSALLGLMIYNADFVFLRVLRGAESVGYYTAAYTLVTFSLNLGTAYSMSLLPSLTRLGGTPGEQESLYHTAMAHVFAAGFPAAVGGCLLGPMIVGLLFGPAYREAALPFQMLIWCIPLCLLRDIPLMALMARKQEGRVLRVTAVAALLNLVLNAVMIPPWGVAGAAGATLMTEAVRMVVSLVYARREGFPLAGIGRFWRAGLAGLVMAGLLAVWGTPALWLAIPVGALAYAVTLAIVGGLSWRPGRLPALTV